MPKRLPGDGNRAVFATLLIWALLSSGTGVAQVFPTAFSYQGELRVQGLPANGSFDLQFTPHAHAILDSPLSAPVTLNDVAVSAGLFSTSVDFGSAIFLGDPIYLQIAVRPGTSTGAFEFLLPRQQVLPTPYALKVRAGSVTSIELANGSVGSSALAISSVGGAQMVDSSISTSKLANLAITSPKLADGSVTSAKLGNLSVNTAAIANGAVTSPKLAIGAVTASSIAPGAIGALQIDSSQVQLRIAGTCAVGEYFRGVGEYGTLACEPVPGVPRITTVDNPGTAVGRYPAIAIGNDGRPVLSYWDFAARSLKVARCANAACTGSATITVLDDSANDVGSYSAIAIGLDGRPVIGYFDATAGMLKVAKCANSDCTAGATLSVVDNPANVVGQFTSIAINSGGFPVISYYDQTARALKIASCVNASCTGAATITTLDDPANFVGAHTSIAIGSDGLPIVSYADFSAFTLKVAKCVNPNCTGAAIITVVDDPANSVGTSTSIAIGADDLPLIAYLDTSASALKIAHCANADCTGVATITTVDNSARDGARSAAIAIGPDGLPAISYQDFATNALKAAKCANARCTGVAIISTIDDAANIVAGHTTIAIGGDGLPVIGYWDSSVSALKVAKCGTRSCL